MRFDSLCVARLVAVEVDEELVGAPAGGGCTRHADLIVHRYGAFAGKPTQLCGRDLVAGYPVVPPGDLLDEAVASRRFEDADDDALALVDL